MLISPKCSSLIVEIATLSIGMSFFFPVPAINLGATVTYMPKQTQPKPISAANQIKAGKIISTGLAPTEIYPEFST